MVWSAIITTLVRTTYQAHAFTDYAKFVETIDGMKAEGMIETNVASEILAAYPNPTPNQAPVYDDEEGVEAYIRNPPDLGPLSSLNFIGWMDEELQQKCRVNSEQMGALLGFGEVEVLDDIQENALRILDRCNNPTNGCKSWNAEENKQGLVVGMVQSGKTANMLALINAGMRAGYRLFILLAGDKTSLRDQTQTRVNQAFKLRGGFNLDAKIHSPTHEVDYKSIPGGWMKHFRYNDRFVHDEQWTTIIVIKKETNHLNHLIGHIHDLQFKADEEGFDAAKRLPTLIIDDEVDYASQNTDHSGDGTQIYLDLVKLRDSIPLNCYIGYTATPQAPLGASLESPIGYPRDFWWLLEPYTRRDDRTGERVPLSYLGAWEIFWRWDRHLLHQMGRDDWPHHEKDRRGKGLGVYIPPLPGGVGRHSNSINDLEANFLEQITEGTRTIPESINNALIDYLITCGVKWWRHWNQSGITEKPSIGVIGEAYPHHAMMVHLSSIQENQERVRDVVEMAWPDVKAQFVSFNPATSQEDHLFKKRWRLQTERTRALKNVQHLPYYDIAYFIRACIEITEKPIYNHKSGSPYALYDGRPWVYLLNSSDIGMELMYSVDADPKIKTKRAAILTGGAVLSRGLTIEGLCVSVFGRSSMDEKSDTVLQRGRWFGHKMSDIDLICIHLQDESREVFRQIAEADRYLRLQIKQALHNNFPPSRVMIELRNSPFVSPTSKSKSKFLRDNVGFGFSGKRALLTSPSFDSADISKNHRIIQAFRGNRATDPVHRRGWMAWDVPLEEVISLFNKMKCDRTARQVSWEVYADYLSKWQVAANRGDVAFVPSVNVAVMKDGRRQRKLRYTSHPTSPEEARRTVDYEFMGIVGGRSDNKEYIGDAFIDEDESWHLKQNGEIPSAVRLPGQDILIVIYPLDPNYVRKTYYDSSQITPEEPHGVRVTQEITLEKGDDAFVPTDLPVYSFAAWTPYGGPMYDVMSNAFIDSKTALQIGLYIKE